jgi:orotate phosphoribosyltransferase-like protein
MKIIEIINENKRDWTGEQHEQFEKKAAKLREDGLTLASIARELEVTIEQVRQMLASHKRGMFRTEIHKIFPRYLANILVSNGIKTINDLRKDINMIDRLPGMGKQNITVVTQWLENNS